MTEIRQATDADFVDVVALEARVFAEAAWSPRSWESEFELLGDGRWILVARDAGALVGYGVLMHSAETADVSRIAVAPEVRRRGIAGRLMAELVNQASSLGCERVLLEVAASNVAALALYSRHGFGELTRRVRYYADGADAVVMELRLAADTTQARGLGS